MFVPAQYGLRALNCSSSIFLLDVSVQATIVDFCAKTCIQQRFRNDGLQTTEAVYVFPLDDSAAVCAFEAEIDGFVKRKKKQ
jgi:hypothetical protein